MRRWWPPSWWRWSRPSDICSNGAVRCRGPPHTRNSRGGNQHGSHHGQGTEGGGNHVAHHISVVVLAGPDKSALCLHHPGNGVINQRIEIGDACLLKFLFVLTVMDLLENILEGMVVLFGNGIFGGKPQILLCVQRVVKQLLAKLSMEPFRLCIPWAMPGPSN